MVMMSYQIISFICEILIWFRSVNKPEKIKSINLLVRAVEKARDSAMDLIIKS